MDNLTDTLKDIALEASNTTLRNIRAKQLRELEDIMNALQDDLVTDLQEILQKLFKLDIEYCEQCDRYRIDTQWHENNRGDYICQSCYESLADRAYELCKEYHPEDKE